MGKGHKAHKKPCCLLGCENNRENPDIMPFTQELTWIGHKNTWKKTDCTELQARKQTLIYMNFLDHLWHFSVRSFHVGYSYSILEFRQSSTGFQRTPFCSELIMLFKNQYIFFSPCNSSVMTHNLCDHIKQSWHSVPPSQASGKKFLWLQLHTTIFL